MELMISGTSEIELGNNKKMYRVDFVFGETEYAIAVHEDDFLKKPIETMSYIVFQALKMVRETLEMEEVH